MNLFRRFGFPGLAALFAWLWTACHLSTEWTINEQYHYGWGVFPLALWMAATRRLPGLSCSQPHWAALCVWGAVGLFFLGELLRWHDPFWRLTGALLFAGAALLTASLLLAAGGWGALRSQLFPLCFAATAVPWPMPLELAVTRRLLHLVTTGAVDISNLLGVAALQRGNVIEVRGGLVGLEAACSGVQSLQASLMASLFLGEYFLLSARRRFAMILAGAGIAIAVNFSRVLGLTLYTSEAGEVAAADWHNNAGLLATLITFALLCLVGRLLASRPATLVRDSIPATAPMFLSKSRAVGVGALLIVLAPVLCRLWFAGITGSGDVALESPRWRVEPVNLASDWRAEVFPPQPGDAALRYSHRDGWRLRGPGGVTALLVHFWWEPGSSVPAPAFTHTPAFCLPGAGWHPRGPANPISLNVNGEMLPALVARFSQDGIELNAFQILAAGGRLSPANSPSAGIGGFTRLSQLWRAPRIRVNEELLLYVSAASDAANPFAEAEAALASAVRRSD